MPSPHWTPMPAATEVDRSETVPDGVSAANAADTSQPVSTSTARMMNDRYTGRMGVSFRQKLPKEQDKCHRVQTKRKGRHTAAQQGRASSGVPSVPATATNFLPPCASDEGGGGMGTVT